MRLAEFGKTVQGVADVAERDEAEDREADEERENPEQERRVANLGAVVPNLLRGLPRPRILRGLEVQGRR